MGRDYLLDCQASEKTKRVSGIFSPGTSCSTAIRSISVKTFLEAVEYSMAPQKHDGSNKTIEAQLQDMRANKFIDLCIYMHLHRCRYRCRSVYGCRYQCKLYHDKFIDISMSADIQM